MLVRESQTEVSGLGILFQWLQQQMDSALSQLKNILQQHRSYK